MALDDHCPGDRLVTGVQPIRLSHGHEPEVDFALIPAAAMMRTPVRAADAFLVCDVLSRGWDLPDREERIVAFAAARIPSYWILDLRGPRITFTQFLLGDDGDYYQPLCADGLVTIDVPWEITLDLPGWTCSRDRLLDAARSRN